MRFGAECDRKNGENGEDGENRKKYDEAADDFQI
jgi:hypothetical protein